MKLLFILLILMFILGCGDNVVEPFYKEQLVRVYSLNGSLLFVGEYEGAALPYITVCKIVPKALGGKFKPSQCALIDTRSNVMLIDASEGLGVHYE